MFCKWCGMESAATDLCSWCHRSLSATTTDAPTPAAETPVRRATPTRPLVEEEEEAEEESPLATGITAEHSAHRPAPAHRPVWTPVPRAGASAASPPPASSRPTLPQSAPPTGQAGAAAPVPTKAPETEAPPSDPASGRPVIGVRRPSGSPGTGPVIGVRRSGGVTPPPAGPTASPTPSAAQPDSGPSPSTSRPPMPGVARPGGSPPPTTTPRPPMPGGARPGGGTPAPAGAQRPPVPKSAQPAASANKGPAPAVSRDPFGRTLVPATTNGAAPSAQTAAPLNRTSAPSPLVTEDEEGVGLAAGVAAGKRAAERPAGIPALGNFTPVNSKYYTGQVVDVLSGNQYDSVTGQATSAATAPSNDEIVLHWDDPLSTPLHFGRFALAFAGLLIGMTVLSHLLPGYAAAILVIVMLAAGILLPTMRAVPFQSEDTDDIVWLVMLTLLFGPGIGLLVYSIKAFMLRDMNIAVLGVLIVGFLGYVVFQLGTPLPPVNPDANEGLFNLLKLAPPWNQVGRYGYVALLYNWGGLVAMIGWFIGNVFHKLDE